MGQEVDVGSSVMSLEARHSMLLCFFSRKVNRMCWKKTSNILGSPDHEKCYTAIFDEMHDAQAGFIENNEKLVDVGTGSAWRWMDKFMPVFMTNRCCILPQDV